MLVYSIFGWLIVEYVFGVDFYKNLVGYRAYYIDGPYELFVVYNNLAERPD